MRSVFSEDIPHPSSFQCRGIWKKSLSKPSSPVPEVWAAYKTRQRGPMESFPAELVFLYHVSGPAFCGTDCI